MVRGLKLNIILWNDSHILVASLYMVKGHYVCKLCNVM